MTTNPAPTARQSRYDSGLVREVPLRTDEGFVRVRGVLTRTGVLEYLQADGRVVRELRSDAEVLAPDSLRSLENLPLTVKHPEDAEGKRVLVTPVTWPRYSQGSVGVPTPVAQGIFQLIESSVLVAGADALAKLGEGWRELSCGYECDLDLNPGVDPKYGPYDRAQKNIRYNHVALVPAGRAGSTASLRMDAAEEREVKVDEQKLMELMAKMEQLIELLLKDPSDKEEDPSEEELAQQRMDALEAYAARKVELAKLAQTRAVDPKGKTNAQLVDAILAKALGERYRADASDEVKAAQLDVVAATPIKDAPRATRRDALAEELANPQSKGEGSHRERAKRSFQANLAKLREG